MADLILRKIINGRDVQKMKCSEAEKIVADFYMEWELKTLGRNQHKCEYLAAKALKRAGLEFFA